MKRVVGSLLGLALLVLVILVPAVVWDSGTSTTDSDFTISRYTAHLTVADNGDLSVDETLVIDFVVSGKHGIFRFWDRSDTSAPHARRTPHDIRVTRDGSSEPFETSVEDGGRFDVAKIGSAGVVLSPGEHTYTIHYAIDGVLEPGTTGQRTQLYWNLVPDGPTIDRVDVTVDLPVAATGTRCAEGAGATGGCTARGDGTTTLRVRTGRLAPHTPVTVKTGLDMPTPPLGGERPWTVRMDPVLGPSPLLLGLVVLVALLALGLGWRLASKAHETDPQFPLMYAPPEGIGPAQAQYLLTEDVDRSAYVATLMHAAEKGAVTLDRRDDGWAITDQKGAEGWAGLDPVTAGVAHLLGGPGSTFVAAKKDVAAGQRLKSEVASFETSVRSWASTSGHMVSSGLGGAGGLVVIGAAVVALGLALLNPLSMSVLALVPGLLAIGAAPLVRTGSGTRRTASGRDLWSRAGGFRRVLATPSAQERFDFSGRQDLYTAYIPWAVAFGCAEQWAAKYRTETGAEPPVPAYLAGAYVGSQYSDPVSSMVDDFSATVDSAISSYQATQSHSSGGGGGGFSGGGGGGGGGVGSW
ncbi:MAG: DUF2207 domain-containing protein [Nocardioides sp.]